MFSPARFQHVGKSSKQFKDTLTISTRSNPIHPIPTPTTSTRRNGFASSLKNYHTSKVDGRLKKTIILGWNLGKPFSSLAYSDGLKKKLGSAVSVKRCLCFPERTASLSWHLASFFIASCAMANRVLTFSPLPIRSTKRKPYLIQPSG